MDDAKLKLYGTDWCLKSANLRNYLQSIWVDFEDHNVELEKEAEEKVRSFYNGDLKFPTIAYKDDFLKNPSIQELNLFLETNGLK